MRGRGRWVGGQGWAEIKWQGTPAPLRILVPEPRAKVSFWPLYPHPFPPPVRVCLLKQRGVSHPQAMFTLLSSPKHLPMGRGCMPSILQMKELRPKVKQHLDIFRQFRQVLLRCTHTRGWGKKNPPGKLGQDSGHLKATSESFLSLIHLALIPTGRSAPRNLLAHLLPPT